jgi:PAS domain S-box-containing protein
MPEQGSKNLKFEPIAPTAEMRSILEHSERSIIILDPQYRILWFNSKAAREMHGFFHEEIKTGNSYWDYVDPGQNKRFIRNFEAALKKRVISTEQKIAKPGGQEHEIWIEGRFSPLLGKAEVVNGVIYSYINITTRKNIEREVDENANMIEAINLNASQGFMMIDEQDRIISCNKLAPQLLSAEDRLINPYGLKIDEWIHPYWREEFRGGLKVARSGGNASIEFDRSVPDLRTLEIRFTSVKGHPGNERMVSVWAFDITDKKKAEQDVKSSEENLRAVFNSSSQTFYLLDRKLNILAFNQAASDLVREQYCTELTVGMNVSEITATENLMQFKVETERAFSGRKVQVEKHFLINGKEYWFDRHLNPVVNSQGKIDRITLWSMDITDRKKIEKALKENESKFRKLASLLPVGIYQVDANGNTIYINESLQLIIGSDMISILDGSWTQRIHKDDIDEVRERWRTIEQQKDAFSMEYRFVTQNGKSIYVLEQAQPLFNHLGEYRGYLGTMIDISEQKHNQQLLEEKKVAENSLKFRSDFLASMSHEIRTPLNGIMGLSEILLDTKLTDDQRSKLQNILGASTDLRSIVNDVLSLSELESGKVALNLERFKVSELITMVAERYAPEARLKGLELSFKTTDVDVLLTTDRRRLTQVLSNLVRNAIKFTQSGRVSVSVEQRADGELLFEVMDTGSGIPENDLQKLFQDFSQLQHTTAQNLEGTGLGLSISKKLVALLKGQIGVRSKLNAGSTFWFSIPLDISGRPERTVVIEPKIKREKESIKGIRVLLVEDNLINQQAFKIMLQKMGCRVRVLSNGKQAVDNFDENEYDIVFMDIQMPEMDGLEATSEIRKRFENVPPVIGLSGNILQRDEDGNLTSEMDDLLLKPVVSHDIERMIKKWVA